MWFLFSSLIVFIVANLGNAAVDDAIEKLMYTSPISANHCVKLFTQTGSVGCNSSKEGNAAPLWMVKPDDNNMPDFNYIAVVKYSNISSSLMSTFTDVNSKCFGVILLKDDIEFTSLDVKSPSSGYSIEDSNDYYYPWNSSGKGLLWKDYNIPIVVVTSEEDVELIREHSTINTKKGLKRSMYESYYMANLSSYMGKDKTMNSEKCLNRFACRPLGGQSVWATKGEFNQSKDIIMVVAKMDSNSMFHDLAYGANDGYSALIALMAAADALTAIEASELTHQISFGLFQGESFGHIGSRKFLNDIQSFRCLNSLSGDSAINPLKRDICLGPLKLSTTFESLELSQLKHVIAVDQVGFTASKSFYVHKVPGSAASEKLANQILTATTSLSTGYSVSSSQVTTALPPTSLDSFLKANSSISGAIISGYDSSYENLNYSGIGDDRNNIQVDTIVAASEVIVKTLLSLATDGRDVEDVSTRAATVDAELVSTLVNCFLKSKNCDLISSYTSLDSHMIGDGPLSNYVGVYDIGRQPYLSWQNITSEKSHYFINYTIPQDQSTAVEEFSNLQIFFAPQLLEKFVYKFMAKACASKHSLDNTKTCTLDKDCVGSGECVTGTCVVSSAYYHDAVSPSLKVKSLWSFEIVGEGPVFTEPNWGGNYGPLPSLTLYRSGSSFELVISYVFALVSIVLSVATGKLLLYTFANEMKLD